MFESYLHYYDVNYINMSSNLYHIINLLKIKNIVYINIKYSIYLYILFI